MWCINPNLISIKESCLENVFSGILLHIHNLERKIIRKSISRTKKTTENLNKHLFGMDVMDTKTQHVMLFMEIEVLEPYWENYKGPMSNSVKHVCQKYDPGIISSLLQRLSWIIVSVIQKLVPTIKLKIQKCFRYKFTFGYVPICYY